jgi:eukaryotic-like serine/threonine-protein kinase
VTVRTLTEAGLWVYDLTRPAPLLPLVREGEAEWAIWGPGGKELFFSWLKDGHSVLAAQAADGATPPRVLVSDAVVPSSLTPDGRFAAVRSRDIVMVTVDKDKARVAPLIQTPQNEQCPEISPDGRWLLYGSDNTGRDEIYVRPYPGSGGPVVPVSVEGGGSPAWNPNGREIFFVGLPEPGKPFRLMAAAFTPGAPQPVGPPKELFSYQQVDAAFSCDPFRCYDVGADGQRFYAVQTVPTPPAPPVTHINLILNWAEQLKQKAPVKR